MEIFVYRDGVPEDARHIREEVFQKEQGFAEEFDAIDDIATHLVLYHDGEALATLRFFHDDQYPDAVRLGRMAVVKHARKNGYGRTMLEMAAVEARRQGAKKLVLSGQLPAQGFYEACGYHTVGESYLEEGFPHIHMEKDL